MPESYRVGRHLGRTVYRVTEAGDELIGVMDTPELGALVVEALNVWSGGRYVGPTVGDSPLLNRGVEALAALLAGDRLAAERNLRLLTGSELTGLAAAADRLVNAAFSVVGATWPTPASAGEPKATNEGVDHV